MTLRIVPAIDLMDGACVRLKQGHFSEKEIVGTDPVEVAKRFEEQGFGRLHVVDLSGARAGRPQHLSVLEAICSQTTLEVDFSGGLRSSADLQAAFSAGAKQVVVGSSAVKDRSTCESWFAELGGERIILGLDVLHGTVRVSGWEEETALDLPSVVSWYLPCGLKHLMSTDISRDGMMQGASVDYYRSLISKFPSLSVIASGGVSNAADIRALSEPGVSEVIVGKALYAGAISLPEVAEFVW